MFQPKQSPSDPAVQSALRSLGIEVPQTTSFSVVRKRVSLPSSKPTDLISSTSACFNHSAGHTRSLISCIISLPFDLFENTRYREYSRLIDNAPDAKSIDELLLALARAFPLYRAESDRRAWVEYYNALDRGESFVKSVNLHVRPGAVTSKERTPSQTQIHVWL